MLLLPAVSEARWTSIAEENLQENWELIRQAAWVAGIEDQAPLLAAIIAQESDIRLLRGVFHEDIWGPGQLHWPSVATLLRSKGIAQKPEELILDMYTGLLATAVVLADLREKYPNKSMDIVLCIYGCGRMAVDFKKDCPYSRDVSANLAHVHRSLWKLAPLTVADASADRRWETVADFMKERLFGDAPRRALGVLVRERADFVATRTSLRERAPRARR